MKLIKLFKSLINAIADPDRDISERLFLGLVIISEVTVFIALIGDIITGESKGEIFTLIATLILVPVTAFISLYKNKIGLEIKLIVTCLVFVILPMLFFRGGGAEGGGVLWFIFAFIYAGLALSGGLRVFILFSITIINILCYVVEYYHPELVNPHSRAEFYIDSCISVILVGAVSFGVSWLQTRMFKGVNERAKKEAERAEELTVAQNRFFSSMSHEIRTPINSILGLNELILRDEGASDEVVKDASGIQGAGKMLLSLINDILDFSKMEAGSMDIVPVDYKIGDMLSEIVNMIWLRATDKGLDFNVSIDPDVPSVLYGDEVRIKQVIVNLLNNAVKYTQEGSVELHVESTLADDDSVVLSISVSDTGMGIKKEALPYLFDAFKRVDEEKNRHIEGTGLGLSIVRQIVELMNGEVSVNSVYGEGSTFTVVVKQGISDPTQIGDLNIHSQQAVRRDRYESSFKAPEAAILIVDDNEMNLEVESKLLAGTQMVIDKALSGKEALELSLKRHYDAILMDHLMPEMDGIECLEKLRDQAGGLNKTTHVIVLTANAGSENRELYNRAGFDGYLVKPVSGEALEETLIAHINPDKLIVSSRMLRMQGENIDASSGYSGKVPVIITASSMCDIPDALIKQLHLPIIPFRITTDEGVFKDGVQMGADELVRYISAGGNATSSPHDEETYTEFFANVLKRAHHVIHISITSGMSIEYDVASEAAKSFDNVTVINSECLSSAAGILVLIAHKLAQMSIPVDEIIDEIKEVRHRLRCSFVIDTTEYMASKGLISQRVHRIAKALYLHPSLVIKDNKSGVGNIWAGSTRRAYKNYIKKAFPVDIIPDQEVAFITYVDVPVDTLHWIRDEISKYAYFEHVVFKRASAAISSNCGPGTFGILYFVKSNKSYNIGSYFSEDEDVTTDDDDLYDHEDIGQINAADTHAAPSEPEWYERIEGIDASVAIANSGSEDAFKQVLKIFYDAIPAKSSEIEGFYSSGDFDNYTIKVHALKSSAKLIGALGLSEKAQLLENAGKERDLEYISANHAPMMEEFLRYRDILSEVFEDRDKAESDEEDNRPVADEEYLREISDRLIAAAEDMNSDSIEEIFEELDGYSLTEDEKARFNDIRERSDSFDYEGMVELLKN